jgi:hypothetical protein
MGSGARGGSRRIRGADHRRGTVSTVARAPKAFVDAMPQAFHRSGLRVLPRSCKSPPVLAVDHEITYAEAEPMARPDATARCSSGDSRAALRDPAFAVR